MATKKTYSPIQIGLHWTIAAVIAANYFISEGMPEFFDRHLEGELVTGLVPTFHIWAGSALLVLVLLRLAIRLIQGAPETDGNGKLARIAALGHWVMYGMMIAVPAFGAIAWFGKTELTAELHVLVMNVMMLAILGHAAMALFHQYVLKDGLLRRMVPQR